MSSQPLHVELLDSSGGHPLQSWEFDPPNVVVIGRSRDCTVVIGNPYVSRNHARLECTGTQWQLTSLSNHGVLVGGQRRETLLLEDGAEFRLGGQGPWLRVRCSSGGDQEDQNSTISFDPDKTPLLVLDSDRLASEVEQIAGGDYFSRLKDFATRIKQRPTANGPS